jgi:hypothetical protein
VQQNLAYAARAIELAQPFTQVDLEHELWATSRMQEQPARDGIGD